MTPPNITAASEQITAGLQTLYLAAQDGDEYAFELLTVTATEAAQGAVDLWPQFVKKNALADVAMSPEVVGFVTHAPAFLESLKQHLEKTPERRTKIGYAQTFGLSERGKHDELDSAIVCFLSALAQEGKTLALPAKCRKDAAIVADKMLDRMEEFIGRYAENKAATSRVKNAYRASENLLSSFSGYVLKKQKKRLKKTIVDADQRPQGTVAEEWNRAATQDRCALPQRLSAGRDFGPAWAADGRSDRPGGRAEGDR